MEHSKNHFNKLLLLWSGEFVSAIGSGLTSFGLSVYVFRQTGSASAMAFVTLLAFLPALLLSAPAGVLADRYDRRLLMVVGDGLSATGLFFILLCMLQGEAQLWQICVGVTISSVFSSLLEPAYKATVTDLLTPEQYTKASGLVGIAGSAKYLISPVLAGFLLAASDIRLLLILDICTFFLTVTTTLVVKRGLVSKKVNRATSFLREFFDGWRTISKNRGVLILVLMASVATFFVGFIQTLFTPLFGAGIFMAMVGLREDILLICTAGFLFFLMLPFANTSIDFLIRINIDNELQGRAWGFIGVISQLGYVVAYAISGALADGIGALLELVSAEAQAF